MVDDSGGEEGGDAAHHEGGEGEDVGDDALGSLVDAVRPLFRLLRERIKDTTAALQEVKVGVACG
jgi:hypothetical protein